MLPDGSKLSDLVGQVLKANPAIKCSAERMVAAVNEEYQNHTFILSDRDTVALIPPVSGG